MRKSWKVALAQIASRPFLLEDNLQAAVDAAGKAADAGAEVILFPEMFLTGYVLGEAAEAFAMPVEASALAVLRQCAAPSLWDSRTGRRTGKCTTRRPFWIGTAVLPEYTTKRTALARWTRRSLRREGESRRLTRHWGVWACRFAMTSNSQR